MAAGAVGKGELCSQEGKTVASGKNLLGAGVRHAVKKKVAGWEGS
jgi:hypothetical protein